MDAAAIESAIGDLPPIGDLPAIRDLRMTAAAIR
jgi:hypothetical protein